MIDNPVKLRYYAKEFAWERWHVIGPNGLPVYDEAPYGKDKPIIFKDQDLALEYIERCNKSF